MVRTGTGKRRRVFLAALSVWALLIGGLAVKIVLLVSSKPTISVNYAAEYNERLRLAGVDPNDNAAPYYKEAFARLPAMPDDVRRIGGRLHKYQPSSAEWTIVESWLASTEEALQVVHQAAQKPGFWVELSTVNIDDPVSMEGLDFAQFRDAILCLRYRAQFPAATGDVPGTCDCIIYDVPNGSTYGEPRKDADQSRSGRRSPRARDRVRAALPGKRRFGCLEQLPEAIGEDCFTPGATILSGYCLGRDFDDDNNGTRSTWGKTARRRRPGLLAGQGAYAMNPRMILMSLALASICGAQGASDIQRLRQRLPTEFREYTVVLEPDQDEPEWWAGAPSVARGKDGTFWLACRMRTADAPRGLRGYEIRILRSRDGIHFTKAHSIRREDVPIPGFERPALLTDPRTGRFKLYGCGPWKDGPWSIIKFDDANEPTQFRPASARPVISPRPQSYDRDVIVNGYKDPFILFAEGQYHCYVIGTMRRTERIYHCHSSDGERWEPVGSPYQSIMDLTGWHDFYVRPACVVPVGVGYLFFYEGSNCDWHDPVYNIATGVGFTFDLHRIIDLTPDAPLVVSTTPSEHFHTWRYSHWMQVGEELWAYAEVAKPNESNEIRLFRLP